MAKSADAFRTISEVSDWLDTPAHVLRFWESKFSQVKPVKRAGGRRYYRPSDMELLGGIKRLLHEDGMTIKGVQKLLREKGIGHVSALSQPLDDVTAAVRDAMDGRAKKAKGKDADAGTDTPANAAKDATPAVSNDAATPANTPAPEAAPVAAPAPTPASEIVIKDSDLPVSPLAALYACKGPLTGERGAEVAALQTRLKLWLAAELA